MRNYFKYKIIKSDGSLGKKKLLMNFIAVTAVFSVFYILVSCLINYGPGVIAMSINFAMFIINLILLIKKNLSYKLSANIYIANCAFVAITICTYFSGGLFSPVLPWFILIPTISLLLLGIGRNTFIWLGITVLLILSFGILSMTGFNFPVAYNTSWTNFFATTCIAGLALIVYIVTMVFEKAKETALNKLAVKNKEITDSIQYAKKIQHALLAPKELIDEHLPHNFIFFKPKDIVSGDFYWAREYNGSFYLAICDCTGHGVPGAFMSLLITSFLNEAINEKSILQPDKILDFIRTRILENTSKSGTQDGMDGVVIKFNKSSGSITYASGNSYQTLVQNNELHKLPKDKMPVGFSLNMQPYTLHTIDAKKGDTLYFYTDGYADSFGGVRGKKYTNKQLNQTLLDISTHSLSIQRDMLEEKFEEWKGDLEQIDDVCIIGIRL